MPTCSGPCEFLCVVSLGKCCRRGVYAHKIHFRALPNKDGYSPHQNTKAQLHKDFSSHDLRFWLPKRRLDGGLIVSPQRELTDGRAAQLFGSSVDIGDAWVFRSDVYHGAAPWQEPEDRGYFGTVSLWKEPDQEEEDKNIPDATSTMLLAR